MVGKLSTWSRQANNLRVYQDRARPLTNSGRGVQYNRRSDNNRFCDKIGHMLKIGLIKGKIRILEEEITLILIKTEITEEILGIEKVT